MTELLFKSGHTGLYLVIRKYKYCAMIHSHAAGPYPERHYDQQVERYLCYQDPMMASNVFIATVCSQLISHK